MSFLAIEGLHAFVTGAAGGIGSAIVEELLANGCKVSAHDKRANPRPRSQSFFCIQGDISDEASIAAGIAAARAQFGPIHILAANAGITDESAHLPLWQMPTEVWDKVHKVNVRGTFLTLKHFLLSAHRSQQELGHELPNLAVVVTGSECGKFGQEGHSEYASGKAGLQYGLVRSVKNEIARLNATARVNAVAPGWVDTELIGDRLEDPREMWAEGQATVALKKIARPKDVARAVAFLASHRAAGHISGECISVDGGMEGRLLWREADVLDTKAPRSSSSVVPVSIVPAAMSPPTAAKPAVKICVSVDFDAVSGWLGTGQSPDNCLADYSAGFFSAYVGVRRLLSIFRKLAISNKITWFIPGHSMESFPEQTSAILQSGCELGLHGYCHEGSGQLTEKQEREVLERCMELAEGLTGKKARGYRAPLYQLREHTLALLEEHGFLYDSSLTHCDTVPYWVPKMPPIVAPRYSEMDSATEWMKPLPKPEPPTEQTLVEVPANWYGEDMTPLQFWPHTPNSQGYVDVRTIERMWMDRFEWIQRERDEMLEEDTGHEAAEPGGKMTERNVPVFSLVLHPDTSGMAHVIGMVERFLGWIRAKGSEVEFCTMGDVAQAWKEMQMR